jgi:glycosyltransferase involved in cell wall biosynthesis
MLGRFASKLRSVVVQDPAFEIVVFPVQRGYFSFPLQYVLHEHRRILKWLGRGVRDAGSTWLVCCYPHYADVAAEWPGPVVYYPTDLFARYAGRSYQNIEGMEKRMCQRASLVCPNSSRIAEYLIAQCLCDPKRIVILPNAARSANVLPAPTGAPFDLPDDCKDIERPVAGVIGNMGANVDWGLLREVVTANPWLSWVFVGPTLDQISDPDQREARAWLLALGGRIRFLGPKPYGELKNYARSFDVAVLPYRKREPTYSGSSTRFYEHLAACRPILATDGFEELLHKEPLLKILRGPADWLEALAQLQRVRFHDGIEDQRWRQSHDETWETRAGCLRGAMMRLRPSSTPAVPASL